MIAWVHPEPTSLAALGTMALCFVVFLAALLRARLRSGGETGKTVRSRASIGGVAVQSAAFLVVGFGPVTASLAPASGLALAEATAVTGLMALAIALFIAASQAMGRNWSIVARTREDHELVTWGPFTAIRHPIYTGLFALMLAMAIAFGHWRGLVLGMPLYWMGTWMRVAQEEKLLRARFGAAYNAYAARVKRFVPDLL